MSQSGLARFSGVSKVAVSKLLAKLESTCKPEDLSDALKPIHGKPLKVLTGMVEGTKYSNVDIVPDDVCSAVIEHYAFDAPNPTEQAKRSARGFMRIGLRAYIHGVTGWSSESQNVRGYLSGLIMDEPCKWDEHFDEEWRLAAQTITGWRWNDRVMGKFLNEAVYSYFPQDMRTKLDEVNPMNAAGRRPRKQHQHFEENADEVLRKHIELVKILLQASADIHDFRRLMAAKFQGRHQLSLKLF